MTEIVDTKGWESVENKLLERFGKKPDVQSVIFLIGHRELGMNKTNFSKEEKQDLIHVGICTLLEKAGYYRFVAKDADGWPHFELVRGKEKLDGEKQEILLKNMIIKYFEKL